MSIENSEKSVEAWRKRKAHRENGLCVCDRCVVKLSDHKEQFVTLAGNWIPIGWKTFVSLYRGDYAIELIKRFDLVLCKDGIVRSNLKVKVLED